MTNLLTFTPRRPQPSDEPRPEGATATIVFFPGVRYERVEARPADAVRPAKAAARRKGALEQA